MIEIEEKRRREALRAELRDEGTTHEDWEVLMDYEIFLLKRKYIDLVDNRKYALSLRDLMDATIKIYVDKKNNKFFLFSFVKTIYIIGKDIERRCECEECLKKLVDYCIAFNTKTLQNKIMDKKSFQNITPICIQLSIEEYVDMCMNERKLEYEIFSDTEIDVDTAVIDTIELLGEIGFTGSESLTEDVSDYYQREKDLMYFKGVKSVIRFTNYLSKKYYSELGVHPILLNKEMLPKAVYPWDVDIKKIKHMSILGKIDNF